MADEHAFTNLQLSGNFTEDGEQFRIYTHLNGVEVALLFLDVPSQREKFDEARAAGGDESPSPPSQ